MPKLYSLYGTAREAFLTYIYRGRVERASKSIGLHTGLRRFNNGLQDFVLQLEDMVSVGEYTETIQVGDIQATYRVSSGRERTFIPGFWSEAEEGPVVETVLDKVEPGDVFWDIGSNIGQYACVVGQTLDEGDMVCFEPHTPTADRLEENLELNDIEATVKRVFLSNKDGEVNFNLRQNMPGGMGVITEKTGKNVIQVPIRHPESLIEDDGVPFPTALKMDLAGEEWHVVQALDGILEDDRCHLVVIEVHPNAIEDRGGTPDEMADFVSERGFGDPVTMGKDGQGSAYQFVFEK